MSLVIHNLVDAMHFLVAFKNGAEFMVERLKLDRTIGACVGVCGYCGY